MFRKLSTVIRYFLAAVGAFACLLFSSYACADDDSSESTIDIFYFDLSNDFITLMSKTFDEETRKIGVNVNSFNAYGDADNQKHQLEYAFKNNHVKIINLVDPKMAEYCLKKARETKQRLIFFNRHVNPAVFRKYPQAWFVGTDESTSGPLQAKIITEYLTSNPSVDRNNDGTIRTLLLRGEKDSGATLQRSSNSLNTLAGNMLNISLVADIVADWSREKARAITEKILSEYDIENLELIISNNDAMALGAVEALEKYGYNNAKSGSAVIPVFGIDAIPEAIKAIRDGRMAGTISNDFEEIARICVKLAFMDKTDISTLKKTFKARIEDNGMIYLPYKLVEIAD